MAARQFRGRTFSRGPRRATEWGFLLASAPIVVPANTFLLAGSISQALFGDSQPLTLIRSRGVALVSSDTTAASETQHCFMGVAIVKEAARVAGAASLPDPFANGDDGVWQTWRAMPNKFTRGDTTGFAAFAGTSYEIDSKAQRKIETGESLVLMLTNAHATEGLSVIINMRFLFKLH